MEGLTLTHCPVCHASLAGREPWIEPCRRCQADLSALATVYARARRHRDRARRALAANDAATAASEALHALRLLDVPATRRTLAAALLVAGQTRRALAVWRTLEGCAR